MGQRIECKGAVCWGPGENLDVRTVKVDPPAAGEVRLRVVNTALCHTDEFCRSGADPEGVFPCILGHEAAAVVESVGDGVKSCQVGDLVIPCYQAYCADIAEQPCKHCPHKKSNLCQQVRAWTGKGVMKADNRPRFSTVDSSGKEVPVYHFMGVSSFCEYTVVHQESVAKIDKSAPPEKVCLLGCGVSTGWGAVINSARMEDSPENVGVIGMGTIGLAVLEAAKWRGAKRIIAVDTNPGKESVAKKFGAVDFLNPNDHPDKSLQQQLIDMTDGGLDYSFEAVGDVGVMRSALEACHKGWGECTLIGVAGAGKEISTRPVQFITGRVLRGSAFGGWKSRKSLPELVRWYMEGKTMLDEYITHTLPFSKINEAFHLLHGGDCLRCVMSMSE